MGGGGGSSAPTSVAPPDGVNNPFTTPGTGGGGFFGSPPPPPQPMTGAQYNQNLQRGMTHEQMRTMRTGPGKDYPLLYDYSPNQWNDIVTQAGMQSPTGRPLAGSAQFFQPVYQPQYQNYATTNRLGVSQYGTPMTPESLVDSAYAGIGRFGVGTGTNQMDAAGRQNHINAFQTGQYTPQNFFPQFAASVQDYQRQNPNDRYTQYTQNQPGYMGGFTGFSGGFMPQMQTPFNPYTNSFGGGFNTMGMGGGFMPQQQFQPQMNMGMQTPFSSGMSQPRQPIVTRSAQVRGTPNVMMRRAEGGIASLVGDE